MKDAELKKMTVKQLRELAAEKTELTELSSMKKDELLIALAGELERKEPKKESGKGEKDPKATKNEIIRLKQKKEKLLQAKSKNPKQLRNVRRRIRNLKRIMRKVS